MRLGQIALNSGESLSGCELDITLEMCCSTFADFQLKDEVRGMGKKDICKTNAVQGRIVPGEAPIFVHDLKS